MEMRGKFDYELICVGWLQQGHFLQPFQYACKVLPTLRRKGLRWSSDEAVVCVSSAKTLGDCTAIGHLAFAIWAVQQAGPRIYLAWAVLVQANRPEGTLETTREHPKAARGALFQQSRVTRAEKALFTSLSRSASVKSTTIRSLSSSGSEESDIAL